MPITAKQLAHRRSGSHSTQLLVLFLGQHGILNHLFSGPSNIAGPVGCQSSFCLMKIPMLLRLARAAQRSEAREVCRITPLARTQSERRRRLALATGFRLLSTMGTDHVEPFISSDTAY